jgi:hypothetical protein
MLTSSREALGRVLDSACDIIDTAFMKASAILGALGHRDYN